MRAVFAALALLAVATSRGGCGDATSGFDPCAGKECLDSCHLCAPDDRNCAETADAKVCDAAGRCVPFGPAIVCTPPDPCAGKACGNACVIEAPCRFENPPCMLPDVAGQCDAGGACVPGGAFSCPPADSCMDRGCGVPCAAMDMMGPTACDGSGSCVPPSMLTCMPPTDPCAGKSCGDDCDLCGGMCMFPAATVCDRNGRCVFGERGTCPP